MTSPMKFRVEPFLWLAFSGGGVMAAIFLPVLVFLFALAFPLGWIDPPDHAHLAAVVGHPITFLVLLGIFVMMLIHAAHRFRYTLYDGLQIKHRGPRRRRLLRRRLLRCLRGPAPAGQRNLARPLDVARTGCRATTHWSAARRPTSDAADVPVAASGSSPARSA